MCNVKDCYEINTPAKAAQLEDRAHYAHASATEARSIRERNFARGLDQQAEAMWDHLNQFHLDELKSMNEY